MTNRRLLMKRYISIIALTLGLVFGGMPAHAEKSGELLKSGSDVRNQASLQRGAKLFFNYCVGCHSLKYMRYSRIAADLGLTENEVMQNLNFTGARFDDPVISRMPAELAEASFGKAPPDLSLEVEARGPDWVYTYLNSFYLDSNSPIGWNNTTLPNAAMPFPMWELQGMQTAQMTPAKAGEPPVVGKLVLSHPGKLTQEQYQQVTRDLTSFLEYASEPAALQRHHYGIWVLLFLAFFTLLAAMLKKEYWKDVH